MFKLAETEVVEIEVPTFFMKSKFSNGPEVAMLQNEADVKSILHSLEVGSWVLHNDRLALRVFQVMRIHNLQQRAANPVLLVGRKNQHLRNRDSSLGHFQVLLKARGVGN